MFYKRWWWATVIHSDQNIKVSPEGERGIIYKDDFENYVINAAYSHDGKFKNEKYEFGAGDVFQVTKEKPNGDFTNLPEEQRRRQIFERTRDAILFDGLAFEELEPKK
ncbi:MAG: hypothetical protein ABL936_27810 [Aestuariivirga sp.]